MFLKLRQLLMYLTQLQIAIEIKQNQFHQQLKKMPSLLTKLSTNPQYDRIKDKSQPLNYRQSSIPINLFNLQQRKEFPKPTIKQSMIQKLKKQTEQLKEIKKNISTIAVSRLSQMKRLRESNGETETESQFYQINENGSGSGSYWMGKSIKKFINFNNVDVKENKNQENQKDDNICLENQNPQDSISEISRKNTNQIQLESAFKQTPNIHTLLQQSSSKKSNLLSFKTKLKKKLSSQLSRPDSSPHIGQFSRSSRQLRIRSSLTSFSKSRRQREMTLDMRKQLHQMQSKQKIVQNKIRLTLKQTGFKLEKKIKQNAELIQKHQGLYELIHSRMERQRQISSMFKKKKQEKRLVHESKAIKINITKLCKRQVTQQERKIQRNRSEQTLLDLTYKRLLEQKKGLEKQQKLAYKISFLKNFPSEDLVESRFSNFDGRSVTSRKLMN